MYIICYHSLVNINGSSVVGNDVCKVVRDSNLYAEYIEIPQGRNLWQIIFPKNWLIFRLIKLLNKDSNIVIYWPVTLMGLMFWRDFLIFLFLRLSGYKYHGVVHYHNYFRKNDILARFKKVLWSLVNMKNTHIFLADRDSRNWPFIKSLVIENYAQFEKRISTRNRSKVARIGSIFNVDEFKKFDIILDLARSFHNLEFVHCGNIDKIKDKEELPRNLKLLGVVPAEAIQEFLDDIDLLIHPSIMERMPLVILEALNVGVPVIARDVGFIREYCEGNNTVILKENAVSIDFKQALKERVMNNTFVFKKEYSKDLFQKRILDILENVGK